MAASEWVYENVPTAVTAEWRRADSGDIQRTQLPIKEIDLQPSGSLAFLVQPENPGNDGAPYDLHLTLNHLEGSSELLVRLTGPADQHRQAGDAPAGECRQ